MPRLTWHPPDGWEASRRRIRIMLAVGLAAFCLLMAARPLGLAHELVGRWMSLDPIPARPSAPHWIEPGEHPFLAVARDEHGRVSIDRALAAWQATGMSAAQANQVLDVLVSEPGALVMGVVDQAQASEQRARWEEQARTLRQRWPQSWEALARMGEVGTDAFDPTRGWSQVESRMRASASLVVRGDGQVGMKEARSHLAQAVGNAGLAALELSWADLTPEALQALATGIEHENRKLAHATGWEGGVLGLYGRVRLRLAHPNLADADGATFDEHPGHIRIVGPWWTLPHEWFHALDITLGRQAFAHGGRGTLTSNLGPMRQAKDKALVGQWKQMIQGVVKDEAGWRKRRHANVFLSMDPYLLSHSEALAFSFSSWVDKQNNLAQTARHLGLLHQGAAPLPEETRRQHRHWETAMAQVRERVALPGENGQPLF